MALTYFSFSITIVHCSMWFWEVVIPQRRNGQFIITTYLMMMNTQQCWQEMSAWYSGRVWWHRGSWRSVILRSHAVYTLAIGVMMIGLSKIYRHGLQECTPMCERLHDIKLATSKGWYGGLWWELTRKWCFLVAKGGGPGHKWLWYWPSSGSCLLDN